MRKSSSLRNPAANFVAVFLTYYKQACLHVNVISNELFRSNDRQFDDDDDIHRVLKVQLALAALDLILAPPPAHGGFIQAIDLKGVRLHADYYSLR